MRTAPLSWLAGALALAVAAVGGYAVYFQRVVNPGVAEELRSQPHGERARSVMLLTLPGGRTLPVNYLEDGAHVYAGADFGWWKPLAGAGGPVTLLVRGRTLRGHGRAVRDDPALRDAVFARLRPTVPAWLPEWAKATLIAVEVEQAGDAAP